MLVVLVVMPISMFSPSAGGCRTNLIAPSSASGLAAASSAVSCKPSDKAVGKRQKHRTAGKQRQGAGQISPVSRGPVLSRTNA